MAYKSYSPRRATGRRLPQLRAGKKLTRSNRKYNILKSLTTNNTHYFKRLGYTIPIALTGQASPAALVVKNVGIPNDYGGFVQGWTVSNSSTALPFGSNADGTTAPSNAVFNGTTSTLIDTTAGFGISATFNLSQVQQHVDFTSLFDQYKIVKVKLKLMFHSNIAQINNAAILPTIHYVIDNDDATAPGNRNVILRQEGARMRVLKGNAITITLRPTQLMSVNTSSSGSTNIALRKGWSNCVDAKINHFGFKMWVENMPFGVGFNNLIEILPEYTLAFKDTI